MLESSPKAAFGGGRQSATRHNTNELDAARKETRTLGLSRRHRPDMHCTAQDGIGDSLCPSPRQDRAATRTRFLCYRWSNGVVGDGFTTESQSPKRAASTRSPAQPEPQRGNFATPSLTAIIALRWRWQLFSSSLVFRVLPPSRGYFGLVVRWLGEES